MSKLRGFQAQLKHGAYDAWANGARVVMICLPCGGGKTVVMGDIAREYPGHGCAIAHRSELVGQISLALAREGVRHDIVAPKNIIRNVVDGHMDDLGRSFYDARAKWKVASVDTLLRRDIDPNWQRQVGLVFQDEGHHVLRENKWGRAFCLFPNARGLFPTATPTRADGKGLGSGSDGLVDVLIEGPSERWMIDNGYLTDYQIIAPTPSDFSMNGVEISDSTGDYNFNQMRSRVKSSTTIIGDVVDCYLRYSNGLRGICFAVDVEHAQSISDAFNRANVPSQVVTADTPDSERTKYMQKLCKGELRMLVNVDLFGEGVDVPSVQVVIMARPTASYALYVQQFGRALRLLITKEQAAKWDSYSVEQRLAHIAASEKPVARIHDHVGNIITHMGPPDWRTTPWTLDARAKRTRATDGIPMRTCCNKLCLQPFQRSFPECPYCGWVPPVPADPTRPEHVDGDVVLYTKEMLEELFGKKEKVDGPCYIPQDITDPMVAASIRRKHKERQQAQQQLRAAMSLYMPPTVPERVAQRTFFHTFGIDVLTAQGLGSTPAEELRQQIIERISK